MPFRPPRRGCQIQGFIRRMKRRSRTATGIFREALALLAIWRDRSLKRRQLASMSRREWQDIVATRCDVAAEVEKPFWRA